MAPPSPPYKTFETVNFYTGSSLNRLSWLRTDSVFLNKALASPHTRILPLQNLNPLVHKGGDRDGYLATLSWDEVKPYALQVANNSGHNGSAAEIFGPVANGVRLPAQADEKTAGLFEKSTAGMVPTGMVLVFLGIDEEGQSQPSLPGKLAQESGQAGDGLPAGVPYFALSLTYRPKSSKSSASDDHPLATLEQKLLSSQQFDFVDTRTLGRAGSWPMQDAALVAQARALVDWNERNHFCPACSRKQNMLWAGYKRACSSALSQQLKVEPSAYTTSLLRDGDDEAQDAQLGECPSTTQLSNFSYPRTDPVVIMGVLSPDGERLLLGRQKKWPKGFWSCLAGFIEPGESLEEAVRREVLEESGVKVNQVVYHSSQSWPFPCQLMEGCYGIAASTGDSLPDFKLDLDNELEAAQWFTRDEILAVLDRSAKSHLSRHEINKIDQATQKAGGHEQKDPGSIANTDNVPGVPDDFKVSLNGFERNNSNVSRHVGRI